MEVLIEKLYSMGLLSKQQGLEDVLALTASSFCRRDRIASDISEPKFPPGRKPTENHSEHQG